MKSIRWCLVFLLTLVIFFGRNAYAGERSIGEMENDSEVVFERNLSGDIVTMNAMLTPTKRCPPGKRRDRDGLCKIVIQKY